MPHRRRLLDLLGIDADTFREFANRAIDDQAVIDDLASIGADLDRLANFDPVQLKC